MEIRANLKTLRDISKSQHEYETRVGESQLMFRATAEDDYGDCLKYVLKKYDKKRKGKKNRE